MNVVIVGSGNVGTQLSLALIKADHKIVQIYNRTFSSAKTLALKTSAMVTDDIRSIRKDADVYIIALKDEAILEFASELQVNDEAIVLHTSGSIEMAVLAPYFRRYGVLYPLQTISKSVKIDFYKTPILVESSDQSTRQLLRHFIFKLSPLIYEYNSEQRRALHLAAVISCNFSNYLYSVAYDFLAEKRVDFNLLKPLIIETAEKVQDHEPRSIQTGPASRHDLSVVEMHKAMLASHPKWQEVYELISENIHELNLHNQQLYPSK